jgi:leader peptidase (prepilin peptidase)/N-methyltransferase
LIGLPQWVWMVGVAPFIGSFIGVVTTRFEAPATILFGRSACTSCGTRLDAIDLVPILSWLGLRGRCRHCGGRISVFYPAVELAALAIAGWSAFAVPGWLQWATASFGWALLALGLIDIKFYLLPDFLTLPMLGAGLLVTASVDDWNFLPGVIGAAAGGAFVLVVRYLYGLWRHREGIGLGDAKLLAAIGAWVSWDGLPSVILIAALIGLLGAVIARRDLNSTDKVPFGACLAAAGWLIWLYGPVI